MIYQFDKDIEVTRQSQLVFQTAVSPNWSVNGNPDGGYLMALLTNAALQSGDKKWPLIVTANFAARCLPGPAAVALELIGGSRSFDRWQATLSQEGTVKIRAICTMSDEQDGDGEKRYEDTPPELADPEQCLAMPNFPGYTMFEHLEVRLDPSCVGWMTGSGMSGISEQRGWLSFRDGRSFDPLAVLLAADAFPPAVLASQGAVAWVPTIELSVNLRNIPRTPRLKCVFRSHFLNRGVVEEDGRIWDEDNELVAVSRQIARFRKNG
jgi:hypothetical protein